MLWKRIELTRAGPHVVLNLSIYALCSSVNEINFVACLVEISSFLKDGQGGPKLLIDLAGIK